MADISKIKLPNNAEYNLRDKAGRVYFVKGTQTATTAAWTGAIDVDALFDGLTIAYYLPRTSASGVTLNLTLADGTATGAKEVYVTATTRMTTHYGAGSTVYLTYYSAGSISVNGTATTTDRWVGGDYWNSNTYDRILHSYAVKAAAAVTAAYVIGYNGSTGYTNITKGSSFVVSAPILYASEAIAKDATATNTYDSFPFNSQTWNGGTSPAYTSGLPVYLKGTLSGITFTVDSSTMLTQTLPSTADGKHYMYLGIAHTNGVGLFLDPVHPIVEYANGSLREVVPGLGALAYLSSVTTVNGHTVESDVPANAVFTDHTYNFAGVTFNSGNKNTAEHNANNATANGSYYYSSNGPGTDIGASSADGALYVQSYSGSWVGQIAQDYFNGGLFVRGKNNGTWKSWARVFDSNHKPSASYTPAGTVSTPTITVTPTTASIGSASGWNAGSVPTLGTAIPADDITAWTTNTPSTVPTMAASEGVLTFTAGSNGTAASLSYTAKSIPNVTAVGTKPSLTITSTTVATGIDSATSTKPTFTGTAATITSS